MLQLQSSINRISNQAIPSISPPRPILLLLALVSIMWIFISPVAGLPVTIERRKGGGPSYHGRGTWFVPVDEGGPLGSCGPKEDSNSLIVALNHEQYGAMNAKSSWCGKKIKVEGEKGSIIVTINDACPGCGFGDLDLTPKVFKAVIGDMNKGVGAITWYPV